jgi:HD-GYP domain-containing protein (c-di-GMP phosphodiesterase class II)
MDKTIPAPKFLYRQMLGFVAARQTEVKNEARLNLDVLFAHGEHIVRSLEKSDDLINLAILYYDLEDLTISHAANVAILVAKLGMIVRYPFDKTVRLVGAALIHDIGAGRIPPEVSGRDYKYLTADEIGIFESHSVLGFEAVRKYYPQWEDLAEVILQHHEKCDGQGYPRHLKCDQMRSEAKIISMIDTYESLLHPRAHRDVLVPPVGIQEIVACKGTCYDAGLVSALVKSISIYPVGSYVQLSTGEIGRVVQTSKTNPVRPVVNLILGADGKRITPRKIDLISEYLLTIRRCVPPPIDIHKLLL